ncbi:MAG TPA: HPF/RaiA family ribosome-associated protein [Phycisphaerae bacterium]|nr:HPF/RaiA family ribosome-associated protein [Phycisphaerae bacterium]
MDLKIVVRGVGNGTALRAYAEQRVETALRRYATDIRSATVRLVDETGPRKQKDDKVCSIELKLRGGPVRISEVSDDFKASIALALDRVRASLSRQLSKRKRGVGEG